MSASVSPGGWGARALSRSPGCLWRSMPRSPRSSPWWAKAARARPRSLACCSASPNPAAARSATAAPICANSTVTGGAPFATMSRRCSRTPTASTTRSIGSITCLRRRCGASASPASRAEARQLIGEALRAVGLQPEEILGRFPHQLSGGQRQRVMVARAFFLQPKLIVADEPVSMVDASLRATILGSLRKLTDEHGISVLYITHDLATAYQISDSILVLYRAHLAEAGAVEQVVSGTQPPLYATPGLGDPARPSGARLARTGGSRQAQRRYPDRRGLLLRRALPGRHARLRGRAAGPLSHRAAPRRRLPAIPGSPALPAVILARCCRFRVRPRAIPGFRMASMQFQRL